MLRILPFVFLSCGPLLAETWWSLGELWRPAVPGIDRTTDPSEIVDRFILTRLKEKGLAPSPAAEPRTLIRRLYFDLIGLPPSPEQVEAFVSNKDSKAYEKLVDELLASRQYGERWARHWLDVVHYGDSHGYDKDKLRPNAWPYRDYVIRAFNDDKPYSQFVKEQIAGDVLFPGERDGIIALGFLAAGPWDFIGHVEVPESKIDGRRSRNLDRDDMVGTVMNTFISTTVQCARCHDHKFDPVSMEHYYSLQAVFAAVDRADRTYDTDPAIEKKRTELAEQQKLQQEALKAFQDKMNEAAGGKLSALDKSIDELKARVGGSQTPEYGYHSHIEKNQNVVKWVQVDLDEPTEISGLEYIGCYDNFNNILAGFGFPVRYKIEASDDPSFAKEIVMLADHTKADVPNPGVLPQRVETGGVAARYIRVTATKLALRSNDYILALAELKILDKEGKNIALGKTVTSLDSIEAPVRWRRTNLVDGLHYKLADPKAAEDLAKIQSERTALHSRIFTPELTREREELEKALEETKKSQASLPNGKMVYAAATDFAPQGGHQPTKGKPRIIRILKRGDVTNPDSEAGPGTVPFISGMSARFALPENHTEGDRRKALAEWITEERNPLTWRSIVNRVWQNHFGRGLVDTPNDFGKMGQLPSHPSLLDWLAVEFRDGGQSMKALHRTILNSATYRQSSASRPENAAVDSDNVYLWRMNRRRLDAESVRDSVLAVSGKLDNTMYGPGFRDFVLELTAHSPHYEYAKHDPNDPTTHRRSVYRFLPRSSQQPFMETLDCADPSLMVAKRDETLTPISALSLLNNKFITAMSEHFAARISKEHSEVGAQIEHAFELALSRKPTESELAILSVYATSHGLPNTCRGILNLNEFIFVD